MSLIALIVICLAINVISIEDFSFMKESALKLKNALNCKVPLEEKVTIFMAEGDDSFHEFLERYNKTLNEIGKAVQTG